MFRFREFPVYREARRFRQEVKLLSKKFPKEEQFVLTNQLWRALDSIVLNIAEGSDRYSDIDFSRFLNNSTGSLNEVVACLDLALDDGYITKAEHRLSLKKAEGLSRQLFAFTASLRKSKKKK